MALIKFLRGSSQNISFDKTPYNDGYLYFTTDDGKLYIDANGERIKINPDQIGCVWGVCETAGSLSAKEIILDEFKLEVGTSIKVKFISSNEVENPTLNINNTGAYPITYRGSAIRPDYLSANGVFEFAFDGDSWEYIGIINSTKEDLDILFLENVEISTLSWEEDASYPDYPYSAKIVCQGVTENHFPNVVFSTIDANSGNFAPVTKTEKNLIYIYAKEIPTGDITIPSIELTPSGIQDLDVLLIENIEISAQSWEQDSTYPDYPYSAKIAYQGVTGNYFPNVAFSTEDANGGNFAPIAKTEENLIYIYAKKVPEGNIIIPSIELTPFDEGNAAVVVLDATLTKEGMAADAKAVGDRISEVNEKISILEEEMENVDKQEEILILDTTFGSFTDPNATPFTLRSVTPYVAAGPSIYKYEQGFETVFPLKKESEYRVVFDGVEYILTADQSGNSLYLGDENMWNDNNVSQFAYPFAIGYYIEGRIQPYAAVSYPYYLYIYTTEPGEYHTIQIYETGKEKTGKLVFKAEEIYPDSGDYLNIETSFLFRIMPNCKYKVVVNGKDFYCDSYIQRVFSTSFATVSEPEDIYIISDQNPYHQTENICIDQYKNSGDMSIYIRTDEQPYYNIEVYKLYEKETDIDPYFTESGMAADASAVGQTFIMVEDALSSLEEEALGAFQQLEDRVTILEENPSIELDESLTTTGKAADAKAVGDKFTAIENQVNKLDKLIYDGTLSNFVEQSNNKYLYTEKIERASIFFDSYKNYRIVLDGVDYYPLQFYDKAYNSVNNETRNYYGIEASDGNIQIEVKPGYLDRSKTEDTFMVFMNNIEESHSLQIYEIQDFTEKLLLKETLTDFTPETEDDKVLYYIKNTDNLSLDFIIPNNVYKVVFDDKIYYLEARTDSEGAICLGEKYILFGIHLSDDVDIHCEECPFCILVGANNQLSILAIEDKESHSIEIYKTISDEKIVVDATLTKSGAAADAKVVGNIVAEVDDILREIYNKIETSGSSFADRPIYENEIFTSEVTNVTNEVSAYAFMLPFKENLKEGKDYIVHFDGKIYQCKAYKSDPLATGSIAIGNGSHFGLPGNNEPFAIGTIGNEDTGMSMVVCLQDTTATEHTISLYEKYDFPEGVVSWNDLTDRPFGEEKEFVFEGFFESEWYEDTQSWEGGLIIDDSSMIDIIPGQEYTVILNGKEYKEKCIMSEAPAIPIFISEESDEADILITREIGRRWVLVVLKSDLLHDPNNSPSSDCKIFANKMKYLDGENLDFIQKTAEKEELLIPSQQLTLQDALESQKTFIIPNFIPEVDQMYSITYNGNNYRFRAFSIPEEDITFLGSMELDPFAIMYFPELENTSLFGVSGTAPEECVVEISKVIESYNEIKPKNLPFKTDVIHNKGKAVLAETGYNYEIGNYQYVLSESSLLNLGSNYIVVYNGIEYYYPAIDYAGMIVLGNVQDINSDDPDAFIIAQDPSGAVLLLLASDPTSNDPFTIGIYKSEDACMIHPDALPKVTIPEFDFSAMGLPTLALNGGEVSIQCDCTELCAALEQGATKISFIANVGQEVPVSGTVNAMKMLNGYSCGFVGCYTGIPMILSFDIYTNQITGRIISILQAVL